MAYKTNGLLIRPETLPIILPRSMGEILRRERSDSYQNGFSKFLLSLIGNNLYFLNLVKNYNFTLVDRILGQKYDFSSFYGQIKYFLRPTCLDDPDSITHPNNLNFRLSGHHKIFYRKTGKTSEAYLISRQCSTKNLLFVLGNITFCYLVKISEYLMGKFLEQWWLIVENPSITSYRTVDISLFKYGHFCKNGVTLRRHISTLDENFSMRFVLPIDNTQEQQGVQHGRKKMMLRQPRNLSTFGLFEGFCPRPKLS